MKSDGRGRIVETCESLNVKNQTISGISAPHLPYANIREEFPNFADQHDDKRRSGSMPPKVKTQKLVV